MKSRNVPEDQTSSHPWRHLDLYFLLVLLNTASVFLLSTHTLNLDYRAFYSAGRVALVSPSHVFDPDLQFSSGLWGSKEQFLAFYHPPHELVLFAPLSLLPFFQSLILWRLVSVACFVYSANLLARNFYLPWRNVLVLGAAMFSTTFCLLIGQDSVLLLLLLSLSLHLSLKGRDLSAGALLALALFKPQVPLVIALAFLLSWRKRLILGFLSVAVGLGVASFALLGTNGVTQMLSLVQWSEAREIPSQMLTFRGFFSLVWPDPKLLSAFAALAIICAFVPLWRKIKSDSLLFGSAILVGSLSAFHFHGQDAVILLIPLLLIAVNTQRNWMERIAVLPFFFGPLFLALLPFGLNGLFAIPMTVLAITSWRRLRSEINSGRYVPEKLAARI